MSWRQTRALPSLEFTANQSPRACPSMILAGVPLHAAPVTLGMAETCICALCSSRKYSGTMCNGWNAINSLVRHVLHPYKDFAVET